MIKINVGCGRRNFGRDWVHIDGGNYPHLDSYDITQLCYPMADGTVRKYDNETVDLVYASCVLEYFDREGAVDILKEWVRVLKFGGKLRLSVPDFQVMANLYTNEDYPIESFLGPLYGKMPMREKTIYHKTAYDYKSLKKLLEASGINNIRKYDWRDTEHSEYDDHSQAYLPHMDKENGTLIQLNIEGEK